MDYQLPKVAKCVVFVMESLFDLVETALKPKSPPDACKSAVELRAYANSIARSDPGFSQDLIAAIDRQEQGSL